MRLATCCTSKTSIFPGPERVRCGFGWLAARRRWGTAAQWSVVPEHQAVLLPAQASDDLGAGLGVPALTAHHCLFADGPLAGKTMLVNVS
ncbi:MAG: hypothetical protein ACRDRI_23605 [Pseudonocardiaceae bacterium]